MINMRSASSARPVLAGYQREVHHGPSHRTRAIAVMPVDDLHHHRPGIHAPAWNISRCLESDQDQWPRSSRIYLASLDSAHGHAQLFGWVGTFILGIGFYSIPKLRKLKPFALWSAWLTWALWVMGVTVRWLSNIYSWHWRIALPLSAVLEVAAFLIFFQVVASHRPSGGSGKPLEPWIFVVIAATLGLLASLLLNLGASFQLAFNGASPAFPHLFDQRYLIVSTWGFIVPMVWGFSARWLPVFMGLRPLRNRFLLLALSFNTVGAILGFGFFECFFAAGILLLSGAAMIFCVGQRILPAFCGMRILWSPRLMLLMLVLLMTGCTLRVASEILAYQDYAEWAWNVLPVSALIELTAVVLFAINLIVTFARPSVVVTSPLTMMTE
jgi:hypothetical protein